jgi:hypothetical protein
VILRRHLTTNRPQQQLRTALNVAGVLEQTLTPFRGPVLNDALVEDVAAGSRH